MALTRCSTRWVQLYTDDDLAEMFQLSKDTVVRFRQKLGWPHVKMGRQIRYTEAQIAEIVALHSHVQTEEGRLYSRGLLMGLTPGSARHFARTQSQAR